jgi:ATP-dependent RNA helicase RhlE
VDVAPLLARKDLFMPFRQFPLNPHLHEAVAKAGYEKPTPIQVSTIPLILQGLDVIGTAQTGTGKTAAYALPILHRLMESPGKTPGVHGPRCLVVTPTRELALQILENFKTFAVGTQLQCAAVFGGVGFGPQEEAFQKGYEVIVACPGRLLDHMRQGHADLKGVEVLVLDEADRMLDMGFLPDVHRILELLPKQRQTLLFSATFEESLNNLIRNAMHDPQRVDVGRNAPASTIAHSLCPVPMHLKMDLLLHIVSNFDAGGVLIFTRTKHRADRIADRLIRAGFKADALHADKSQSKRQQALEEFKSGKLQALVATDIASRGLDIDRAGLVVNYDIPETADTYIHRIGRTGRAERSGEAITLVTDGDLQVVEEIESHLGGMIEQRWAKNFDYQADQTSIPGVGLGAMPGENLSAGSSRPGRGLRPPRRGDGQGRMGHGDHSGHGRPQA